MRQRRARIVAEIIDHVLHRLDLIDDGLRRAVEQLARGAGQLIGQLELQPFGGKLDRRQRILDLMSQALRHFAPRGRTLRGYQPRDVVEHHHVAAAARARQGRAAHQQRLRHAVGARDFELFLPFVAAPGEAAQDGAGQRFVARPVLQPRLLEAGQIVAENRRRAAIRRPQAKAHIESQHAGGQIRQHRFEIGLRRLGLQAMVLGLRARLAQLMRHAVEGMRQHAQFVGRFDRRARREVATSHRLRAFGQDQQRPRQTLGQKESQGNRGEQRQQQGQRQGQRIDALQAHPAELQFLIIAVRRLDTFRAFCNRQRHRQRQLQYARIEVEAAAADRRQRAQHETAAVRFADQRQTAPAACEAQLAGRRHRRQQAAQFPRTAAQHLSRDCHQGCALSAGLFARPVQSAGTDEGIVTEIERRAARLRQQVGLQGIEHAAAEVEAAFERRIDAHIEPRINALHRELHRYAIYQRAGQNGHQGQHQQQARLEPRAEHAAFEIAAQPAQLQADQHHQRHRGNAIDRQQPRIVLGKQRRIGRRRRQQEQQDRAKRGDDRKRDSHCVTAGATNCQRNTLASTCKARSVMASTWKGLGNWLRSSARRTAAS